MALSTSVFISPWAVLIVPVSIVLFYLVPFLLTFRHLRGIPGPLAAQVSNLWLLIVSRAGKRYLHVDEVHKRYGPVVRIQPNHVSIADEDAIGTIYGHGTGLLKSSWYDASVITTRSIFTSRDRAEHSRKRKVVSHSFSPQSMRNFEPFIHSWLTVFLQKWDELAQTKAESDGYANVEGRVWLNYLVLDIIGDLAFGAPFGVLESASEDVKIKHATDESISVPVITSLTTRSEIAATMGTLPEIRPYLRWIPDPFFHAGVTGMNNLRSLGTARILDRLNNPLGPDRHKDLLERLREGRDDKGQPFGQGELTAEALTVLIAGTDTTSSTFAALMYHVVRTPGVLSKLQVELDTAIPADTVIPSYDQVKALPYLGAIINESLRHHSSISLGLPREVPRGPGLAIKGQCYPPGTILSVPIYTVHHLKDVWGPDAEDFRPERWEAVTPRQKKAFIPFSYGPRACLGRNLAEMELRLITATWARRYDFVLRKDEMAVHEGLARKPIAVNVGLKRR